jgi:hypothetical protein
MTYIKISQFIIVHWSKSRYSEYRNINCGVQMVPYTVYVTIWWHGMLIIQYLGNSLFMVWWCTPWLRTDTSGGCCGHSNEPLLKVRNFLTSNQLLKASITWNYYVLWNLRDLPLFSDICCLFLNTWKVLQTLWPYAVTRNTVFQKTGVK